MLTIAPLFRLRMLGRTALIIATGPKKLVANSCVTAISSALLNGRPVTVACIVHEHVDDTETFLGLPHRVGDLRLLGHVQRKREGGIRIGFGQVADFAAVTRGDDRVVSAAQDRLGQMAANAGGAAGNQPCGHVPLSLRLVTAPGGERRLSE